MRERKQWTLVFDGKNEDAVVYTKGKYDLNPFQTSVDVTTLAPDERVFSKSEIEERLYNSPLTQQQIDQLITQLFSEAKDD